MERMWTPERQDSSDAIRRRTSGGRLTDWLETGNTRHLEEMLIQGKEKKLRMLANSQPRIARFLDIHSKNIAWLRQMESAIESGDLSEVKALIERKRMLETRDKDGRTPLHMAVLAQNVPIALHLFQCNSFPCTLFDKRGRTPLHLAALLETPAVYDALVSHGAQTNLKDKFGTKAEEYAENPEAYRRWETESGELEDPDDRDSDDFDSIIEGDEVAEMEEGPPDDQVKEWLGRGAIVELERLVLNGGAERLRGRESENDASQDFLDSLPHYQSKMEAIHKAVEEGDVRRVKSLIDRPSLATARDRRGLTPLHKAVLHAQTDVLRFLLHKYYQTVNVPDREGRTPLHYAAADDRSAHYVKLLQKAGADAFIEDKFGHTPFYYRSNPDSLNFSSYRDAVTTQQLMSGVLVQTSLQDLEDDISDWLETGNMEKLEELVLNGYGDLLLGRQEDTPDADTRAFLDILPQYAWKMRAIHRAAAEGNLKDVKNLIDRKKLALCRDAKGSTPLHNAVLFSHEQLIIYLLKNYPQAVNSLDHKGRTPMHYAAGLRDSGKVYKVLRKSGGDTTVMDSMGKTPKQYLQSPADMDLDDLRAGSRSAMRQDMAHRVAPSYMESSISKWVREGNVGRMEQLVLSGCGDLLLSAAANAPEAKVFLNSLPATLDKIRIVHYAVRNGDASRLARELNHKRYALARDVKGCTPLHNAVLYDQEEPLRFIIQAYPTAVNAPDYAFENKRTAVHYAAVASDDGHLYQLLKNAGGDTALPDNVGCLSTTLQYRNGTGTGKQQEQ